MCACGSILVRLCFACVSLLLNGNLTLLYFKNFMSRQIPSVPVREPRTRTIRTGCQRPEPRRGNQGALGSGTCRPCRCVSTLKFQLRAKRTYGTYSGPEDKSIYVDANTRIQILDTMLLLPNAEKEQCAAFIVRLRKLLCNILNHANRL